MQLAEIIDAGPGKDRRGAPRRETRLVTDCTLPGTARHRGLVVDLSAQGMRLLTAARLPAGEPISFRLSRSASVEGEVMWQHDLDHGIRFTAPLSPAALAEIVLSSGPQPPAAPHVTDPGIVPADTRAGSPDLRGHDMWWIAALFAAVNLWFVLVDAFFAVADRLPARR